MGETLALSLADQENRSCHIGCVFLGAHSAGLAGPQLYDQLTYLSARSGYELRHHLPKVQAYQDWYGVLPPGRGCTLAAIWSSENPREA